MFDLSHCKRVWLLTDTHLGVRNSLEEWVDIHYDYFHNHFIPLVKREYKKGDVLFHLGDMFDSRHAITLKVMDMALDIFEELAAIFGDGIYLMVGNHDCYFKTSNHINSLRSFKRIPNVKVIDIDPVTIKVHNSKFLILPWQKDHKTDLAAVEKYGPGHDYLMCHMDVYGMKGSRFGVLEQGMEVRAFDIFKHVYSGHIHYRQIVKNVTMLGTPYELTRSDMYNEKVITILDVENDKEILFPNKYSPRFLGMSMSKLFEKTPEELKALIKNNFVDVYIDNMNFLKVPVNMIIDILEGHAKSISFIPPTLTGDTSQILTDDKDIKDFSILDAISDYCMSTAYDDDTKMKMKNALVKIYDLVIKEPEPLEVDE